MRPEALVVLLALPFTVAAASDEVPQTDPAPQTPNFKIEAPAPAAPFDFRQGRDWGKYLSGARPRVLLQQEAKALNAEAGTCYTMRILPVDPSIDPAMVLKMAGDDFDPKMVLKTPPACEQGFAEAPTQIVIEAKP